MSWYVGVGGPNHGEKMDLPAHSSIVKTTRRLASPVWGDPSKKYPTGVESSVHCHTYERMEAEIQGIPHTFLRHEGMHPQRAVHLYQDMMAGRDGYRGDPRDEYYHYERQKREAYEHMHRHMLESPHYFQAPMITGEMKRMLQGSAKEESIKPKTPSRKLLLCPV